MSTKKPKRRANDKSSRAASSTSNSAPARRRSPRADRPVSDKRVAGEIMGALLTAITFGALEAA